MTNHLTMLDCPCTQCLILQKAALIQAPVVLISLCCLARQLIPWNTNLRKQTNKQFKKNFCDTITIINKRSVKLIIKSRCLLLFFIDVDVVSWLGLVLLWFVDGYPFYGILDVTYFQSLCVQCNNFSQYWPTSHFHPTFTVHYFLSSCMCPTNEHHAIPMGTVSLLGCTMVTILPPWRRNGYMRYMGKVQITIWSIGLSFCHQGRFVT